MTTINVTKTINVSATDVWEKLKSFRGIEEVSPIERSEVTGEGEGAKRTCYLPDGAAIHEVLTKVDEAAKTIQYKITKGPFPVQNYLSTVIVTAKGDGCEVSWGTEYDVEAENAQAMEELFSGFYNVIIDSLESVIAA